MAMLHVSSIAMMTVSLNLTPFVPLFTNLLLSFKKKEKNQRKKNKYKKGIKKNCSESNSSPLLVTNDVQLVEPCINEAIGNETTDDNLIPLHVITHVTLTMLTGDTGWIVLLVSARVSPVPGLQTGHNEYPKR